MQQQPSHHSLTNDENTRIDEYDHGMDECENGIKEVNSSLKKENNIKANDERKYDSYEIKEDTIENMEKADSYCNECKLIFPSKPELKEHIGKDHIHCCYQMFPSTKSLNSRKSKHSAKKDMHYPEIEKEMSFFGVNKSLNQAQTFDKDFLQSWK